MFHFQIFNVLSTFQDSSNGCSETGVKDYAENNVVSGTKGCQGNEEPVDKSSGVLTRVFTGSFLKIEIRIIC